MGYIIRGLQRRISKRCILTRDVEGLPACRKAGLKNRVELVDFAEKWLDGFDPFSATPIEVYLVRPRGIRKQI
jgi:hypothetical protein